MNGVSNPTEDAAPTGSGNPSMGVARPWQFLVLVMPLGLQVAWMGEPMQEAISRNHVSDDVLAGMVALSIIPPSWKFLWGPVVDTTFTRRTWYVAGVIASGLCDWLVTRPTDEASPPLTTLTLWMLAASFAASFVSMSVASLMAGVVPDARRGRVSGLYRAGILGAVGLGGGLAAWLMKSAHCSGSATSLALSAISVACCFAWKGMPDLPPQAHAHALWIDRAEEVFWDLWTVMSSRQGYLVMALCILPLGSCALFTLWDSAAADWHFTIEGTGIVGNVIYGTVGPAGSLAAGWICDRFDRKASLCAFGLVEVVVALGLAFSPRTPAQYVFWSIVYCFVLGLNGTAVGAAVLEAIGRTNGATKYSLRDSLRNMKIAYMTFVVGVATQTSGVTGMLLTVAALGVTAIAAFVLVARLTRPRQAAPVAARERTASG